MEINRVTPVVVVDAIEPSLAFWEDRLGFERVAEVPLGDALGFVILKLDDATVMIQSRKSVEDDLGLLTSPVDACTCLLYLDVKSLEPIKEALAGCEVVVGERKTFYGAREIYYREPGGHIVGFAVHQRND